MLGPNQEERINAIRHFNRFLTRQMGLLHEGLLHSPYSLAEARILFELGRQTKTTAANLGRELGMDAGYLSRMLARFEEQGLIYRTVSGSDGRQRPLHLTTVGQEAFTFLDQRSRAEVGEMLNNLSEGQQHRLLDAMETIESVLGKEKQIHEPYILRMHEPGDMGWVIHRHGVLYTKEYGWNAQFEALVAQIAADFINNFNPARERCWIAERDGEIVGSVFVVQADETAAKLRLLLVEPKARGMGLGSRLVAECIRFAQRAGYQKLTLWTQSVLVEARRIYQNAGFTLVTQGEHYSFGHDLVEETWELLLQAYPVDRRDLRE